MKEPSFLSIRSAPGFSYIPGSMSSVSAAGRGSGRGDNSLARPCLRSIPRRERRLRRLVNIGTARRDGLVLKEFDVDVGDAQILSHDNDIYIVMDEVNICTNIGCAIRGNQFFSFSVEFGLGGAVRSSCRGGARSTHVPASQFRPLVRYCEREGRSRLLRPPWRGCRKIDGIFLTRCDVHHSVRLCAFRDDLPV